jgi:hypothetical protein
MTCVSAPRYSYVSHVVQNLIHPGPDIDATSVSCGCSLRGRGKLSQKIRRRKEMGVSTLGVLKF